MTNEIRLDQVRVGLLSDIKLPMLSTGHILKVVCQFLNFLLIYKYLFYLDDHGHDRS